MKDTYPYQPIKGEGINWRTPTPVSPSRGKGQNEGHLPLSAHQGARDKMKDTYPYQPIKGEETFLNTHW